MSTSAKQLRSGGSTLSRCKTLTRYAFTFWLIPQNKINLSLIFTVRCTVSAIMLRLVYFCVLGLVPVLGLVLHTVLVLVFVLVLIASLSMFMSVLWLGLRFVFLPFQSVKSIFCVSRNLLRFSFCISGIICSSSGFRIHVDVFIV